MVRQKGIQTSVCDLTNLTDLNDSQTTICHVVSKRIYRGTSDKALGVNFDYENAGCDQPNTSSSIRQPINSLVRFKKIGAGSSGLKKAMARILRIGVESSSKASKSNTYSQRKVKKRYSVQKRFLEIQAVRELAQLTTEMVKVKKELLQAERDTYTVQAKLDKKIMEAEKKLLDAQVQEKMARYIYKYRNDNMHVA